jgi:hypothetical protein
MRFPVTRECVWVEAREGRYRVVRINRGEGVADVVPLKGGGGLLTVPLTSILPLGNERTRRRPGPRQGNAENA